MACSEGGHWHDGSVHDQAVRPAAGHRCGDAGYESGFAATLEPLWRYSEHAAIEDLSEVAAMLRQASAERDRAKAERDNGSEHRREGDDG